MAITPFERAQPPFPEGHNQTWMVAAMKRNEMKEVAGAQAERSCNGRQRVSLLPLHSHHSLTEKSQVAQERHGLIGRFHPS